MSAGTDARMCTWRLEIMRPDELGGVLVLPEMATLDEARFVAGLALYRTYGWMATRERSTR